MLFKSVVQVRDLLIQRGSTFDISPHRFPGVSIQIRSPSPEDSNKKLRDHDAICITTCDRPGNDKVRGMFDSLAQGKLPPGWVKAENWEWYLLEDGQVKDGKAVLLRFLPQPMRDYLQSVREAMRGARERVLGVIRWRYNIAGGPLTYSRVEDWWSPNGQSWYPTPFDFSASLEIHPAFNPSDNTHQAVAALLEHDEPTGHELFREAWENKDSNPRSSLLIGIAALEVGFKECVTDLIPATSWLVEHLPSPPVTKMLTEYLPTLPAKRTFDGKVLPPPKPIIDTLKNGVHMRNTVTHTAADPPSSDSLEGVLLAVEDMLWLLDYYRGHDWALDYLREETRQNFVPDATA